MVMLGLQRRALVVFLMLTKCSSVLGLLLCSMPVHVRKLIWAGVRRELQAGSFVSIQNLGSSRLANYRNGQHGRVVAFCESLNRYVVRMDGGSAFLPGRELLLKPECLTAIDELALRYGRSLPLPASSPLAQRFSYVHGFLVSGEDENSSVVVLLFEPSAPTKFSFVTHSELFLYGCTRRFLLKPTCPVPSCCSYSETWTWPPRSDDGEFWSWLKGVRAKAVVRRLFPELGWETDAAIEMEENVSRNGQASNGCARICAKGHITVTVVAPSAAV